MKKPICAVKDLKLGLFDTPITFRHIGEAIREFDSLKTKPETKFGSHPGDFELFQVATFDEELGTFENLTPPLHLG